MTECLNAFSDTRSSRGELQFVFLSLLWETRRIKALRSFLMNMDKWKFIGSKLRSDIKASGNSSLLVLLHKSNYYYSSLQLNFSQRWSQMQVHLNLYKIFSFKIVLVVRKGEGMAASSNWKPLHFYWNCLFSLSQSCRKNSRNQTPPY